MPLLPLPEFSAGSRCALENSERRRQNGVLAFALLRLPKFSARVCLLENSEQLRQPSVALSAAGGAPLFFLLRLPKFSARVRLLENFEPRRQKFLPVSAAGSGRNFCHWRRSPVLLSIIYHSTALFAPETVRQLFAKEGAVRITSAGILRFYRRFGGMRAEFAKSFCTGSGSGRHRRAKSADGSPHTRRPAF